MSPTEIQPVELTHPLPALSRQPSASTVASTLTAKDLPSSDAPTLTGLAELASGVSGGVGNGSVRTMSQDRSLRRIAGEDDEGDEEGGGALPPVDGGRGAVLFIVAGFVLECVYVSSTLFRFPLVETDFFFLSFSPRRTFVFVSHPPVLPPCATTLTRQARQLGFLLLFPLYPRLASTTRTLVFFLSRNPLFHRFDSTGVAVFLADRGDGFLQAVCLVSLSLPLPSQPRPPTFFSFEEGRELTFRR